MEYAAIDPDVQGVQSLGPIPEKGRWGFQPHSARLSPDGTRIAFGQGVQTEANGVRMISSPDAIQIHYLNGKIGTDKVVEMPGSGLGEWHWSPDGSKLAFTGWDKQQQVHSWVVDVQTREVSELPMPRFRLKDKEYPMTVQGWSPDGWILAGGAGLSLIQTESRSFRQLVSEEDARFLSGTCRFSPDGRQLLFVAVDGKRMPLRAVDVATGKVRVVVDRDITDTRACWSPDGRRIAYSCTTLDAKGNRVGGPSLFVANADGTDAKRILTEEGANAWLVPLGWMPPAASRVKAQ